MAQTVLTRYADRSRMQTRQKCKKERFLAYHAGDEQMGYQKVGGKYDAAFGDVIHKHLSKLVFNVVIYVDELKNDVTKTVQDSFGGLPEKALKHYILDQYNLALFLLMGWAHYRRAAVLDEYLVLVVEKENRVIFHPHNYLPANLANTLVPLEMPLRMDALLRHRHNNALFVLDFKTASRVGADWERGLENSLQTNLYIAGTRELYPGEYVGGIMYEGLLKGKREVDKANSSPFKGFPITYGSLLYAWKKGEVIYPDYAAGRQRVFIPSEQIAMTTDVLTAVISVHGEDAVRACFPNTIPVVPATVNSVVGQQIMAENQYQNDVEFYQSIPAPERWHYEGILFEQTLDACYKYGTKHPCAFVEMCHGNAAQTLDGYETRVDHHTSKETVESAEESAE